MKSYVQQVRGKKRINLLSRCINNTVANIVMEADIEVNESLHLNDYSELNLEQNKTEV